MRNALHMVNGLSGFPRWSRRWAAVPLLALLAMALVLAGSLRGGSFSIAPDGAAVSGASRGMAASKGQVGGQRDSAVPAGIPGELALPGGVPGTSSNVATSSSAAQSRAAGSGAAPAAAPAAPAAQTGQSLPPLPSVDRMIVKNGALTLRVTDLGAAIQRVNTVVAGVPGAYVASSSTTYRSDQPESAIARDGGIAPPRPIPTPAPGQSASIAIKVPADAFGETMQRLRDLGTPVEEQVSTQEVTEEYVDLESQVRNLEATEQQYLRLMERAQRIEEILPIQQRLTEVRNQIERIRGRMTLLQRRADSSTISLSLIVPGGAGDPAGEPRAVRTLRQALSGLLVTLSGLLDVLIYVGVYVLPAVPFVLLYLWWRSRHPRGGAGAPAPAAGGAV